MASSESDNEIDKANERLDVLKSLLNLRNKIMRRKPIELPNSIVENADISDILGDDGTSQIEPHPKMKKNKYFFSKFDNDIRELQQFSESKIKFNVQEDNEDNVVRQTISGVRKNTAKLFQGLINAQTEHNEHLNNDLLPIADKKTFIKNHTRLIEETCKYDKGLEDVIHCDKDKLKQSVENGLKIKSVAEFEKTFNEMAEGILSTIFESGTKKFKNHEHLLAIKEYNKPSTGLVMDSVETTGRLDPFTQQPITKPVFNKVCKHMYDYDSVDQMFQRKLFIACPHIGCANKKFTKKDILFDLNSLDNSNE